MKTFNEKIYEKLKLVPIGKVVAYKELAKSISSNAYRAVGSAMKNNKNAPIIPCHRVIKSNGEIGGFCGKISGKKIQEKINLLKKEGVKVINGKINKRYFYFFPKI